eukprot:TRINITY_DN39753_c0_g1_i1.p2 TRINITY_DN39753_c0_g1~~TRINITY_DN39753_c0_g1_i1.p2  ORF type:complete len:122 (-),score=22.06 TRINITY_DN39753_c0_g1_i1:505-870(-)
MVAGRLENDSESDDDEATEVVEPSAVLLVAVLDVEAPGAEEGPPDAPPVEFDVPGPVERHMSNVCVVPPPKLPLPPEPPRQLEALEPANIDFCCSLSVKEKSCNIAQHVSPLPQYRFRRLQ